MGKKIEEKNKEVKLVQRQFSACLQNLGLSHICSYFSQFMDTAWVFLVISITVSPRFEIATK